MEKEVEKEEEEEEEEEGEEKEQEEYEVKEAGPQEPSGKCLGVWMKGGKPCG